MNTIFFGADRPGSIRALSYLHSKMRVISCICDKTSTTNGIVSLCKELDIPFYEIEEFVPLAIDPQFPLIDIGFCYSYHFLIPSVLISLPKNGIINFHPSPLPDHKGVAGCCYALEHGFTQWGVSVHYIDEKFDTGSLVEVDRFPINCEGQTGIELDHYIQKKMYSLFRKTIDCVLSGKLQDPYNQCGKGHYYSRKDLNRDKYIKDGDGQIEITRKINAMWFPPYHGASIEINGQTYTLVNEMILTKLATLYDNFFDADWEEDI